MYLDLEYRVRTDGAFRQRIAYFGQLLDHYEKQTVRHSRFVKLYNDTLRDFLRFCQFNLVFMTPYYFPRYPKDKPLSFANYPFAYQMFNFQIDSTMAFKGSRQISKSTAFGARQLLETQLFPGFASMYICPRSQQLATYANRLRDLERSSRFYRVDHKFRQNLNYKEIPNRSRIELAYVLSNANNVRSRSADSVLLDECQHFDPTLELEVMQVQSATETKITIYAGTSITTDTFLEAKYNISSQASWVMKCDAGHYNVPLPEFGVMDMIQPAGPSCAKCGKLLNIRTGQFQHADTHLARLGRLGFHVPQIIVPAVVNNPRRWAEIYELKCRGDYRKFLQEILGIATEEGEREITRKQLQAICTLGRDLNVLHLKARQGKYMFVVSGCDWGGSDYIPALHLKISTTVHVVMGVTSTGQFEILHFQRYSGMGYDDIANDIVRNHLRLRGDAIASDFGVGAAYNSRLREKIPMEKHLIFNYTGPVSALIDEPAKLHMYNQWSLNKTESISMTYDAVRRGRIRCYAWEMAEAFLSDFMNMYRAPGEKAGQSGMTTFVYRSSASKPNDALQAVNYAFMLGKILLQEPMFADLSMMVRLNMALSGQVNYVAGSDNMRSYSG